MKAFRIIIYFFVIVNLISCSSKKLYKSIACSRQYSYLTRKLTITGMTAKLKKAGVEYADLGITEVTIDPKYIVASEKLQQLDLLQYSLCQQLNTLPQKDSNTAVIKAKYINSLIDMLKIAQKQDTVLSK